MEKEIQARITSDSLEIQTVYVPDGRQTHPVLEGSYILL
jgi:hypothetical protein